MTNIKQILTNLKKLGKDINIIWDRVVSIEDEEFSQIVIYGWINRKNKQRDFVLYMYLEDDSKNFVDDFWATSSAKYSEKIAENMGQLENHNPCIKFKDWLQKNGIKINDEKYK